MRFSAASFAAAARSDAARAEPCAHHADGPQPLPGPSPSPPFTVHSAERPASSERPLPTERPPAAQRPPEWGPARTERPARPAPAAAGSAQPFDVAEPSSSGTCAIDSAKWPAGAAPAAATRAEPLPARGAQGSGGAPQLFRLAPELTVQIMVGSLCAPQQRVRTLQLGRELQRLWCTARWQGHCFEASSSLAASQTWCCLAEHSVRVVSRRQGRDSPDPLRAGSSTLHVRRRQNQARGLGRSAALVSALCIVRQMAFLYRLHLVPGQA